VFTLKNHDVAFKQLVEHQKTTENVYLVCAANWSKGGLCELWIRL